MTGIGGGHNLGDDHADACVYSSHGIDDSCELTDGTRHILALTEIVMTKMDQYDIRRCGAGPAGNLRKDFIGPPPGMSFMIHVETVMQRDTAGHSAAGPNKVNAIPTDLSHLPQEKAITRQPRKRLGDGISQRHDPRRFSGRRWSLD